jgi:hypothetical protein
MTKYMQRNTQAHMHTCTYKRRDKDASTAPYSEATSSRLQHSSPESLLEISVRCLRETPTQETYATSFMNRLIQDSPDAKDMIAAFGGLSGFCEANCAVLHYKHDPQGRHRVALVGDGPDWDDVSGAELLVEYLQKQMEVMMRRQKTEVKTKNTDPPASKRKNDATAVAKNDATAVAKNDATAVAKNDATAVAKNDATAVAKNDATAVAKNDATAVAKQATDSKVPGDDGHEAKEIARANGAGGGSDAAGVVKTKVCDDANSGKQKMPKCKYGAGCRNMQRCK